MFYLFMLLLSTDPATPLWLRQPVISPDGSFIAFSYQGDLFRVDAQGGLATALTRFSGYDGYPIISPDNQTVVFASNRYGNFDLFVLDAQGGPARRLTFHSADDYPLCFSPDGQSVFFQSRRQDSAASAQFPYGAFHEVYQIPLQGGKPLQWSTLPFENISFLKDGRVLYQNRPGGEDTYRKHHTSSVTRDVCLFDPKTGQHQTLTTFAGEDLSPCLAPDQTGFYYLSERFGTANVVYQAFGQAEPTALTHFSLMPVRDLSISQDATLCFSYDGQLYTQKKGSEPQLVALQIFGDEVEPNTARLDVKEATEMALSPNGKEIAFVFRGEVFVTAIEAKTTKQITHTPQQERSISFSPDGSSLLYASERGTWNLYQSQRKNAEEPYFFNATVLTESPVLESPADIFQPQYSPDGKEVAFIEERTMLRVVNLASKQVRTIMPLDASFSYADGDQHYDWSPDGKWFLVNFLHPNYWIPQIGLVSSAGNGEIRDLSQSGYASAQPRWMMKGDVCLFFSSRDGMHDQARSGSAQSDVYGYFFNQKAFDRFQLSEDDFKLLKEQEEKAEKDKKDSDKTDKGKDKKKEPEKLPELKLELENLADRKVRFTIHSANLADAVLSKDGEKLYYLAQFEKGFDLWQTELRSKKTKILAKLGARSASMSLDKEGKNLFVLAAGSIQKIDLASEKSEGVSIDANMDLDQAGERAYLFEHIWRQVTKKFYKTDLHGAAWPQLVEEYKKFLPHINNNFDFQVLLSELLGELNASHTGARYRPSSKDGDSTASLGLLYDLTYSGPELKVTEVLKKGPFDRADSQVAAGNLITHLNGQALADLGANGNVWALLNQKEGQKIRIGLRSEDGKKTWEEVVTPISTGEESQILYARWVENRRLMTEKLSDGKLGYVHVRSMSDPSYRTVIEEVLGRSAQKQALVVDTRFNGGGDLVDDLCNFLSGKQYMRFITADNRTIGMEPGARWTKPSIVL
ncbi:MAG: PD40 domain-containing protein, partial [Acidobacteria bacterium]|nr:PD40 domain-containing protein [Acidobacteriota bacterium]